MIMKNIPKVKLESARVLTPVELNHLHFATAHTVIPPSAGASDPLPASGRNKAVGKGVTLTVHPSVTLPK